MDKSITRAERGVLPTHEYVAAREMLLHLYEEQAEDGSDSEDEDSSSSDDDDDLDLSGLFSDSDSDDSDSDDEDGSDTDEELEDMLFDAVIAHMDATKRGAPSVALSSIHVGQGTLEPHGSWRVRAVDKFHTRRDYPAGFAAHTVPSDNYRKWIVQKWIVSTLL